MPQGYLVFASRIASQIGILQILAFHLNLEFHWFVFMSKLKLRKNLYIESLEWAKNKQENGFTHSQLREELALNDLEARWVLENLFGPVNGAPYFVRPQVTEEGVGQNLQYYLSAHAFSELNDFYELREARKNATSAFWLALASMFIAGIFGILQVQAQLSEAHTWFELICSIF